MIHLMALLGTFLFIAIRLKMEKQKSDDNARYHVKWGKYLSKEWDDWAFSLGVGQCWALGQCYLVFGFIKYKKWDLEEWTEIYEFWEYPIAVVAGIFAGLVVLVLYTYAFGNLMKLINKVTK